MLCIVKNKETSTNMPSV